MKKKSNNYTPYKLRKNNKFEIGIEESEELIEQHLAKLEKLRSLYLEKVNSSVDLDDDTQRNAFFAGVEFQMMIGEYLDKRIERTIK